MLKRISVFLILLVFVLVQAASAADEPLYANLVKGENGNYTITEITSYKNSINLRNLRPVGYDSSVIDCSSAFFGGSKMNASKEKCLPNPAEFRTKKIRFGPTLLLGVTTFGISLLLGVVKVENVFDYDSFNKAVSEALADSGLSGSRVAYVERFTKLYNQAKLYDKMIAAEFTNLSEDYRVASTPIEKKIEDLSGFLNDEEIYTEVLVKVNKKKIASLRPQPYSLPDFKAAPAEFDAKMSEYEENLKAAFERDKQAFLDNFKEATAAYEVNCGPNYVKPYHVSYECPKTILANPGPGDKYSARVIVTSKDFDNIFPVYTNENADLKVTFTKNSVLFENKTKRRMDIKSVAVRYNDKRSAFDAAERTGSYTILPMTGSDKVVTVRKIVSYDMEKAADYKEVTKESAKNTKVVFGMDIKYTLDDDGVPHSLSGDREFTLLELL